MSAESDSYLTVASDSEVETKVKGSRFIGRAFARSSRTSAEETIAELRKKEYDATHHCFAYILRAEISADPGVSAEVSPDSYIFRYSDDGEPGGSAGKPIYDQLTGKQLVDTLLVVTRYYGGTKLGVGGLVRAYSESASLTIERAGVLRKYQYLSFRLETDFSHYQPVLKLLKSLAGEVDDSEFSDSVRLSVRVRVSCADDFSVRFTELTHGQGVLQEQA